MKMKFDNIPEPIKYLAMQLTDVNCNVHNRSIYATQMENIITYCSKAVKEYEKDLIRDKKSYNRRIKKYRHIA